MTIATSDHLYDQSGTQEKANSSLRLRIVTRSTDETSAHITAHFERILGENARQIANTEGIEYEKLSTPNRLLMTRYRCPLCGMLPLFYLDLRHLNKARCGKCSMIVALKNSNGKYGRVRKKVAIAACGIIDEMLSSN